jgi:hypothetical protein
LIVLGFFWAVLGFACFSGMVWMLIAIKYYVSIYTIVNT